MRTTSRRAVVTGSFLVVAGLYACSNESGDEAAPAGADPGAAPATPAGAEAGVPASPDTSDAAKPADASDASQPPKKCAILEGDAGRAPVFEPAACRRCVAESCCAHITKCYGAAPPPADGGAAGSKSSCQLFGECELGCNANLACEAICAVTHGEPAALDWAASEGCIYGAAPAGCKDVCP